MSDLAIQMEGLGKRYHIDGDSAAYRTFRDTLAHLAQAPGRLTRSLVGRRRTDLRRRRTVWALRDISLSVPCGEVMGIIGRNGAGKSTLLKILSRITEPTEGYADLRGRVGSLLEVGTGFHPELTGRENIYLNGAILGMTRAAIQRAFDEIVAFAEVEQFIDMPVKRYSSGMYLRLAFAVAAHLEPEILLVDEVLAVGDAAFQKKCLGRMARVAKEGRTVLFVSHDMTSISVLCRSAILLDSGRIRTTGTVKHVIETYLAEQPGGRSNTEWDLENAPGDDSARITAVRVCGDDRTSGGTFWIRQSICLIVDYAVLDTRCRLNPVFVVRNLCGMVIFSTSNYDDSEWGSRSYAPGHYRARCQLPAHLLNDGTYRVDALLVQETRAVRAAAESAIEFSVHDDGATRGDYVGQWLGVVRPRCTWTAGPI